MTDLLPTSLVTSLRYANTDIRTNCYHVLPESRESSCAIDVSSRDRSRATTSPERLLYFTNGPVKRRSANVYTADVLAYGIGRIVAEGAVSHDTQSERLGILSMQRFGMASFGLDDPVTPVLPYLLRRREERVYLMA